MGAEIKRVTTAGVLFGAAIAALALVGRGQESDKAVPAKATVDGNYSVPG
jgi:hypothetical protein